MSVKTQKISSVKFGNPFARDGKWFRGCLHVHTNQSDGMLSPRDMAFQYRDAGYDFICITDHGKATDVAGLSSGNFLVIRGEESIVEGFDIVEIGVSRSYQDMANKKGAQALIDAVRAGGGETIVAHPYFSSLGTDDFGRISGYLGVEIFNTSVECNVGRGNSEIYWDYLLGRGIKTMGFAVDDAHWHFNDHRPNDTALSAVMVKACVLDGEHILSSIRQGLFYATNGPVIRDIRLEAGKISVLCPPARKINFISSFNKGEKFTASSGQVITEACYAIKGTEPYIRVSCTDDQGRTAWSNPFFFSC